MVKTDNIAEIVEEKLRKTEEELLKIKEHDIFISNIIEYSSQPFGVGYPDGSLGLINRAFEELTGYSKEELKRTDWSEILTPPEFRDMENEKLEELQRTGQPIKYEKEYIRKDGTRVPIELLVHLVKNEDGNPQYYYSFITDITERKKTEKERQKRLEKEQQITEELRTTNDELIRSSKLLSTIYELNTDAIVLTTLSDSKIIDCNQEYLNQIGYTREETIGHTSLELNLISSDTRKKYISNTRRANKVSHQELKVRRKDGSFIDVLYSARHITVNNEKVVLNIGHDITKRKQSEEQKQKLLENEQQLTEELQVTNNELIHQGNELLKINQELEESEEKLLKAFHSNPAAMTLSDDKGRWIDINESYSKLIGYTKDELIGHTSSELNIISDKERERYLKESQEKGSLKDVDFEIKTKSGEKRTVVSSSELIQIGNKTRFISFIYDITKRKERERLSNILNKVNSNINSKLEYNDIMQSILKESTDAIGAESSVINIREDNEWIVKFVYNFPNNIIGQIKSDQESPTSVYVSNKREAVAFNDAQNDTRVNKNGMKLHGVSSLLAAPIILKDKIKGIIVFYHHQKQVVFSKAQIDFANKLAASLSQAIENAKLFKDLQANELKYHSLYSSMNEGVALHEIIYNPAHEAVDYIITDINPSYEKILDLKKSEVVGKKASELYGTDNPPYLDFYAPVAENGKSKEFETYFEPMNKYFRISVISPEKGKFATVFEDITERKLSEETILQQADIIEQSFDPIIVGQLNGAIESWNQGAEELYGYTENEAIGKPVYELLHTSFLMPWSQISEKIQNGGMWEGEIKHRNKNGQTLMILSRIQTIIQNDGSVKLLETNRDITKRKQNEVRIIKLLEEEQQLTEELSATNEELQATSEELQSSNEELMMVQDNLREMINKLKISNRELEQFAYVASHDLQEPLRMVSSFTQLLERRYKKQLDNDADDYITFIVEGAKRMKQLIDDLLAFSRLNTDIREFEPILMEVALEDVLINLRESIIENNAQITNDRLPTIKGDPIQINQLLQNLIGNAIKFHSAEKPQIHISARELGNECLFSIKDNGIGIDPRHQQQIFSIFKRLHTREEYDGTGIGLSICKRIVERHGGHMWLESNTGEGSIFYFTIPI